MAPIKKVYLEELARIQERIHDLFEQALLPSEYDDPDGAGPPGTWVPAVDVIETAEAFLLLAELPGVAREDVQLHVRDRRLELTGCRHPLADCPSFLRLERSYGPFRRTVELGGPVDADAITASFERGILHVVIPKRSGGKVIQVAVQEEP